MSPNSTLGSRPPAQPVLPASVQVGGASAGAQSVSATGKVAARLPTVDPVALQDDVVSLSVLGLQAPGSASASVSDSAQSFVSAIAQNLFGDGAQTASVSYNLASFRSVRTLSAVDSQNDTARPEAFALNQSISFSGSGQIVTDDGQTFDFEVAVKYEAQAQPGAAPLPEPITIEPPDMLVLTGKPLPAIKFPGSLNDLFKLLSRELRTDVSDGPSTGSMTLRLQRLVDRAALLAPRARADDPEATPVERAKAAASAYAKADVAAATGVSDLSEAA
ncbi:hypothetical protein [Massilia sp. CF038]|uniref:hypothetical protein n=1 Tax=Massilia sp. CF038 TaxID=1881045 RepID=UPI00091ABBAB|nr:hypothetical protein [Massilia sp. CF038]SHG59777.1 hypothetical protein SAMN05428948_1211 [Massilia sp. CF038]